MPAIRLLPPFACALCIFPWLNPFSPGPVPSAMPWLLAAAFIATVILLAAQQARTNDSPGSDTRLALMGVLALCLALSRPSGPAALDLMALAGAAALILLAAALAQHTPSRPLTRHRWIWHVSVLPWLLAGLLSSMLALLQYTGHAAVLAPWVNWAPAGEAFANLRQRNQFASLTNIALAALLAGWVVTSKPRTTSVSVSKPSQRPVSLGLINLVMAAATALLVIGNAASSSRTGLLQLLVLAAMCAAWRRERRVMAWLAWACACYAFGMFVLPWLAGLDPATHGMFARLREGDSLCASRLTLWGNVLQLIAQHPWLGWGWGELDFAHYITLYPGARFCDILDNAHNLPLHLAVELGVPVAVLVCGGIVCWVLRSRPWRETDPLRQMAWMVLVIIAIHSLLEYPLWYGPFQLACGLSLGLLWRQPTGAAAPSSARSKLGLTAPVLMATLMFAACAYAAWDYRRISQIYLAPMLRDSAYRLDTLQKIEGSWLFARQVWFAELSTTTLTLGNAERMHTLALELLHFSPEARVVEKLIESTQLLGLDDEASFHIARFRAAFPATYEKWAALQRPPSLP